MPILVQLIKQCHSPLQAFLAVTIYPGLQSCGTFQYVMQHTNVNFCCTSRTFSQGSMSGFTLQVILKLTTFAAVLLMPFDQSASIHEPTSWLLRERQQSVRL